MKSKFIVQKQFSILLSFLLVFTFFSPAVNAAALLDVQPVEVEVEVLNDVNEIPEEGAAAKEADSSIDVKNFEYGETVFNANITLEVEAYAKAGEAIAVQAELNGEKLFSGDENSFEVQLKEGLNQFRFTAQDSNGEELTKIFFLSYSKVKAIEFVPAPGQHTNSSYTTDAVNKIRSKNGSLLSLGGFGGYLVVEFEEPVKNDPLNPYGIDFTIFGNPFEINGQPGIYNQEPGAVEVAVHQDGPWYHLAGSEYDNQDTYKDYEVTYWNPEGNSDKAGKWIDSKGNEGALNQRKYPSATLFPSINQESYTLSGVSILNDVAASDIGTSKKQVGYGYADSVPVLNNRYETPNNPYISGIQGSGGDAMDISWAVDQDGNPVHLDEIKYVKIYSATNKFTGLLGEFSTEISGLGASEPVQQIPASLTVKSEQKTNGVPVGSTLKLFVDAVDEGNNKVIVPEATWTSSDETIAIVHPVTGKVQALAEGEVTITGSLKAHKSIQSELLITIGEKQVPTKLIVGSPNTQVVTKGGISILTATVLDQFGEEIKGIENGYKWSLANGEIGQVNPFGKTDQKKMIKGLQPGVIQVLVEYEDLHGMAIVKVLDPDFNVDASGTTTVSSKNFSNAIGKATSKGNPFITIRSQNENYLNFHLTDIKLIEENQLSMKVEAKRFAFQLPKLTGIIDGTDYTNLIIGSHMVPEKDNAKNLKSVGNALDLQMTFFQGKEPAASIEKFPGNQDSEVTIKFEVHELDGIDHSKLAAYEYISESAEWIKLGGSYNDEEKSFTFAASNPGRFAVFEDDSIQREEIPVTVRIEGFDKTILPLTKFEVGSYDITNVVGDNDIGNYYLKKADPLAVHAIIKALELSSFDVTDSTKFDFGTGEYISKIDGLATNSVNPSKDGWMYAVNDQYVEFGIGTYTLGAGDEVTVYFTPNFKETSYAWFDRNEIETTAGKDIEITLQTDEGPVVDATLLVNNHPVLAGGKEIRTDAQGKASVKFDESGEYYLSATKKEQEADKITRPFSKVTVTMGDQEPSDDKTLNVSIDGITGKIIDNTEFIVDSKTTVLQAIKQFFVEENIPFEIDESKGTILSVNNEENGSLGGKDSWNVQVNGEMTSINGTLQNGDHVRLYYNRDAQLISSAVLKAGDKDPKIQIEMIGDTFTESASNVNQWKLEGKGLQILQIAIENEQTAILELLGEIPTAGIKVTANSQALMGNEDSAALEIYPESQDVGSSVEGMITETVGFYKQQNKEISSWTSLVALNGAGENLINGQWKLPSWKTKDPGVQSNNGGTEHIRFIFGLLAMQEDPSNAWETNRNLFAELAAQQRADGSIGSINKHAWAMLALDTGERLGYNVGNWNNDAKEKALQYLLSQEKQGGGFAYFGDVAESDLTGMTLLTLSNYQNDSAAAAAIERSKHVLRQIQLDTAGWSYGSENANSIATVLSGLAAIGEDPTSDSWKKGGKTPLDALQRFQLDNGAFTFTLGNQAVNTMATEQSLIALQDIKSGKSVWQQLTASFNPKPDPEPEIPVEPEQPAITIPIEDIEAEYELDIDVDDNGKTPIVLEFPESALSDLILPKITAERAGAKLEILAGTQIISDWDHTLQVPTGKTTSSADRDKISNSIHIGKLEEVNAHIKVGGNDSIVFDRHVTLRFAGLGDKDAGFIDPTGNFSLIPKINDDSLEVYAYQDNNDLVISAKHFTEFLVFETTEEAPMDPEPETPAPPFIPTTETITFSIEKRSMGQGDIISPTQISLYEGDTAYTVLRRVAAEYGISVIASGFGSTVYVSSIDGLAEYDGGPDSGWMYTVNGDFPQFSAGIYELSDGDELRWQYTKTLGEDIGDTSNPTEKPDENKEIPPLDKEVPPLSVEKAKKLEQAMKDAQQKLLQDGVHSEWEAIGLFKSGVKIPSSYVEKFTQTLNDQVINKSGKGRMKITDVERLVLAAGVLGIDPTNVDGHGFNLLDKIYNSESWSTGEDSLTFQGNNGVIFALIALDSKNYTIPKDAKWNREKLVAELLKTQKSDGSWSLEASKTGSTSIDITAMAITALAPYKEQPNVKRAVDKAISYLSITQGETGGFQESFVGGVSSEATAQVIIGLTANEIDPRSEAFTKKGVNLIDHLLSFTAKGGGFKHLADDSDSNAIATEQAFQALVAYDLFVNEKGGLYDFTALSVQPIPTPEPAPIPEPTPTPEQFTDVAGHWADDYIQQAVELGLVKGYANGTFKPNQSLTRAQAVSILVRALDLETDKKNPFTDTQNYAKETQAEIADAYHHGLIKGQDGKFKPTEKVTRSQMALMFYRAYEIKNGKKYAGEAKAPFTDMSNYNAEAQAAASMLYDLGMSSGENGKYMPGNLTSRAQATKMLVEFLNTK